MASKLRDLRPVFVHVLATATLRGADIKVGIHVLGFRDEIARLQIIMILLPQRLGSMRSALLAESHNLFEVRSHMPEVYRPAVEKKKNRKGGGGGRRGEGGGDGEGMRVGSRTGLEMGWRAEE